MEGVANGIARVLGPLRDGKTLALLLSSALLVYPAIVPLIVLVFGSFKSVAPGTPESFTLNLTLENARAFASRYLPKATINTAIFAIGSSSIAFVLGAFLAWDHRAHQQSLSLAPLCHGDQP